MWSASKLSRHCAHHHILSDLNPRPTRDKAAAKGKVFHAALEEWQKSGIVPAMADGDVAGWLQIMVDHGWAWPDGVEMEVLWGFNTWRMFSPVEEKQPHVYEALDGETLITAGRADACWMSGDVLTVVDWKTGRTLAPPARINLQVNAAGIALAQKWQARAFVPCLYYAREGRWDIGDEVDVSAPTEWGLLAEIEAAASLDNNPHPGPHCSDCWERKNCEAA